MNVMPTRPKRSRDPVQAAHQVYLEIIERGEAEACFVTSVIESKGAEREKNPAAVALGKLGGEKGGRARASKLSPDRRREIAKKAAAARWTKNG